MSKQTVDSDVAESIGIEPPGEPLEVDPPAGFESRFATVNGFRMHYVRGGSGSPVVLLHGFPQTWAEWRGQLAPLAERHDVVAVDLRGAGASAVPAEGYDTGQLSDDVHELLVQLGVNDGVQLVAHDIGAWVAYPYAAQWPSEVSRMAVLEGPLPDDSMYSYPALGKGESPSIWHYGFFQEELAETLIAGHEYEFVETFVNQFAANRAPFTPAWLDVYARYLREPGRLRAWLEMYRALPEDAVQNQRFQAQGLLAMPVLAVGGESSLGAAIGDQWKQYVADLDARVLAGSGHWVTEEQPEALTAMLLGFLR